MAAEDVIYFPLQAQLPLRPHLQDPRPPDPVAEPPPSLKNGTNDCPTPASRRAGEARQRPTGPKKKTKTAMIKADVYTELYLWNLNMDRLVRLLQRLEVHGICTKPELKAYEMRLEEIRAALNADFHEVMATRERADAYRFWSWRTALERQKTRAN